MLKNETIVTFDSDGVCFPLSKVQRFAKRLGLEVETFIECFDGVKLETAKGFDVNALTAIDNDGNTHPIVAFGINPGNFNRFLRDDEETFTEFYENHPRFPEVGRGPSFNESVFDAIVAEHKEKLKR